MNALAILRAPQFSPHCVEADTTIMMTTVEKLRAKAVDVEVIDETRLQETARGNDFPLILTMGRLSQTQRILKNMKADIINHPYGIDRCRRSKLQGIMRLAGIPIPPTTGRHGYWLKRGDNAAQTPDDVVFAHDKAELEQHMKNFQKRGVTDYVVSAHIPGDIVKFYGIKQTGFFRYFYPTDDGITKFGNEAHNGAAAHYSFYTEQLQQTAERLASVVGIEIYGGDCIVNSDGQFYIIDFNDWPSFSRCMEEAADNIVKVVKRHIAQISKHGKL